MAFLSLGLNIEQPQSLEESQKAPKELSEGSLSGNGRAAVANKERQEESQVSSDKISNNGTNGTAPKADPKPIEPEKDNWPEMGMQIIQSVLREAQNTQAGASLEPPSAEQISELTSIEELRKKILEGITPDFRVAPINGQAGNGSSPNAALQAGAANK